MKNSGTKYWIIDNTTLEKLQVLKQFVDFVAEQPEASAEHKNNAEKVKYYIENLNKPETFVENWNTCIDIYDLTIQSGGYGNNYKENKGLYWKKWWVWFEKGELTMEIGEEYAGPNRYQDSKGDFTCTINFNKNWKYERIYGDTDFNRFVEDGLNFRKYVTKDLNDVETKIDI
ncbi:MAG: hypothetical protein K9H26_10915 [Prolixibacteraceae bacterium]|nr:hypothetical protein [Prolixibacteraceae bacterium]